MPPETLAFFVGAFLGFSITVGCRLASRRPRLHPAAPAGAKMALIARAAFVPVGETRPTKKQARLIAAAPTRELVFKDARISVGPRCRVCGRKKDHGSNHAH